MRLKNNILLFFSGTAFSAVLAFVQNLIIARSLTLEEFAKFATIMSVCFMGSAFITFRTSEALLTTFRTKPEGRAIGDTSQVFTVSIYAELLPRILLVSLLVLGAPYLVSFTVLNEADVSIFKIATIVVLLNTTSEIWHALARINVKINELAFCDAFFSFLSIVLICYAVYFNIISLQNIILILVCVGLLKFLFQFWRIITLAHSFDLALQFRLRFLKDNEFFNVFKKTMLNGYLMSTVQSPLKYGDILIANLFMQSSEIAIYRIAKSVFNVCQTIPNIIVKLLFYDFVKNIQEHELANIRATLIKLIAYCVLFFLAIFLIFNIFGKEILAMLYGTSYEGSAEFLTTLMLYGCFSVLIPWTIYFSLANNTYVSGVHKYIIFQIFLYVVLLLCIYLANSHIYVRVIGISWSVLFLVFLFQNMPTFFNIMVQKNAK